MRKLFITCELSLLSSFTTISHSEHQLYVFNLKGLLKSKDAFPDALFLSELLVLLIILSKGTEMKT